MNITYQPNFDFVADKFKNWTDDEKENNKFVMTWALAACGAANKSTLKNVSQLGTPLTLTS